MNANAVQEQLIHWTVQHSGHDATRRYLGMSRISECPRVLYHEVVDGPIQPNPAQFLTFYAGYLWERDLKLRLESIGHYMLGSEREIVAEFDARSRPCRPIWMPKQGAFLTPWIMVSFHRANAGAARSKAERPGWWPGRSLR